MNVELLNTICTQFRGDINSSKINKQLSQLTAHLTNMVSQPQQGNHQQNVANVRQSLGETLLSTNINSYSPAWVQVLHEIGFKGMLGKELYERIEKIFNDNTITPASAHTKISEIQQLFEKLFNAISQMLDNFATLEINKEQLKPGESEIAILIPRIAVSENIENFIKELSELKKIVNDFNELATGTRPEIKLKTIASSEYQILLDVLPKTAVCIIIAITLIIKTYKDILEIRKKHDELQNIGVPKDSLKGIENYANNKMEEGIAEGVKELLSNFGKGMDAGRKKEMTISLNYTLNKISNRIDSGFNFDVRMKEDTINEDEPEDKKKAENQGYYNIIQEKSKGLEFMNLTGNKILSLPEEESKTKKTDKKDTDKHEK